MDKLKLIELVDSGMTQREISEQMNCSQTNIKYWMKKYNLKSKNFQIGEKNFYSSDRFLEKEKNNLNWNFNDIQKSYDSGLSWREVSKIQNISPASIFNKISQGFLKSRNLSESAKLKRINNQYKHTEETKKKISEARKKWLTENPDKHPWQNKSFVHSSIPCEKFKSFLREQKIDFIEEFMPLVHIGRFFRIDIAFPDKKIGIEVNGNQHYESNGELKPYYKNRESLLEEHGWITYQIHHTGCFNMEKLSEFMEQIKNSEKKIEFDYFNYVPREKKKYFCSCGNTITNKAKKCESCARLDMRKVKNRPSKNELKKLIWEKPITELGKIFGVSDNAVRKWCKAYGITNLPSRSFRAKEYAKKTKTQFKRNSKIPQIPKIHSQKTNFK
jgi:very-short-patch-repair endonuclease/transposase